MTGLQAFYDGDFDQWMEEAGSACLCSIRN